MFRRLQGHHQGGSHKDIKGRHKIEQILSKMFACEIETQQFQLKLQTSVKTEVNFFTVKNNTSSSIADKRLCPLFYI